MPVYTKEPHYSFGGVCVWKSTSTIIHFMPVPAVTILMNGHKQYSNMGDSIPESVTSRECVCFMTFLCS